MMWLMCGLSIASAQGKKNQQVQPYMNGVGLSAHTTLIPLEYPQSFPTIKDESITTPRFETMGQDLAVGLKGTLFLNRTMRASVNPYYHHGFNDSNYQALGIQMDGDKIVFRERNVWGYYGVGAGAANMRFSNADKAELTATQLYAKAQAGVLYFERTTGYEFSIFATLGSTGREELSLGSGLKSYRDEGLFGAGDQLKGSVYTPTVGLQATVYRGDFRKVFNNKKGNKGKQGKKGNKGRK